MRISIGILRRLIRESVGDDLIERLEKEYTSASSSAITSIVDHMEAFCQLRIQLFDDRIIKKDLAKVPGVEKLDYILSYDFMHDTSLRSEEDVRHAMRKQFNFSIFYNLKHGLQTDDKKLTKKFLDHAKVYLKTLRSVPMIMLELQKVFENIVADSKEFAEAPSEAPLGRIAFASYRDDVPFEVDKEFEKQLYKELQNHFVGDPAETRPIPPEFMKKLREMLSNGWYSKVFHQPPSGTTLYRGMSITNDALSKILGRNVVEDEGVEDLDYVTGNEGGRNRVSSWTLSKETADKFGSSSPKKYHVTMSANVDDNPNSFLACVGGLYDISGLADGYLDEDEVISLAPIKINKISWSKKNFVP